MLKAAASMDKDRKNLMIQLAYASSVGFAMVLAIFGSLLLGAWLDRKFGTGHKLALLFLIIGIVAGLRNIYILIKKNFPDDGGDEPKRNLKNEPHRKRPPPKKT